MRRLSVAGAGAGEEEVRAPELARGERRQVLVLVVVGLPRSGGSLVLVGGDEGWSAGTVKEDKYENRGSSTGPL